MPTRFRGSTSQAQDIELLMAIAVENPEEAQRELTKITKELQASEVVAKNQVKRQKELQAQYERQYKSLKKEQEVRKTLLANIKNEATRRNLIAQSERISANLEQAIEKTTREREQVERGITKNKALQAESQTRISALLADDVQREKIMLQINQKRSRAAEISGTEARFFGDVESRSRALTGAIGYLGGTGIERQANIANEVLASVEAIGLLKVELPQMTAVAKDWAKEIASSITPTMIAGGAAAIALGAGLALAYKEMTNAHKKREEDAKKNITLLKSESEGYAQALELTTQGIDEAVEAQQRRVDILSSERDNFAKILGYREKYNELLDKQAQAEQDIAFAAQSGATQDLPALEQALADVNQQIADLAEQAGVSELSGELFEQAKNQTKEYNTEIEKLNRGTEGLTAAYGDAIVVANDVVEAEQRLAEERKKFADETLADTERALRRAAEWQQQMQTIMPSDLPGIRGGLETDIIVAENMLTLIDALEQAGKYTKEQADALREEWVPALDEARASLQLYNTVATDAAHKNELQAQVLDLITGKVEDLFNFGSDAVGALEDINKIFDKADKDWVQKWTSFTNAALAHQQALEEAEEDRVLTVQRAIADFEQDMANRLADHYIELARMDQDYYEKRADILQDMGDEDNKQRQKERDELAEHLLDMARMAEDHRRKMEDIQREMNMGVEDAVEDRNVSAAIEAIRQGKEEMRAEEEQYDVERKRREEDFQLRLDEMEEMRDEKKKDYQQQLQDLKRNHERQRQENIQDFYREQARRQQEFNIRQQREAEDYQRRIDRMVQHFQEQFGLTNSHYANLNTITEYGMSIIEDTVGQSFANMANAAYANSARQEQLAWEQSRLAAAGLTFTNPPGFADGGNPPVGMPVRVGERGPEWVTFGAPATVWPNGQNPFGPSMNFTANGYRPADAKAMEEIFKQRIIPNIIREIRNRRN